MLKQCLKGCLVVALLAMSGVGAAGQDIPLIEAVKDGDTAAVRALLDKGGDVNAPEVDGTTVLHWAVSRNDLDVADLLIPETTGAVRQDVQSAGSKLNQSPS